MKWYNVFGRDCYGAFWFRGQIAAKSPLDALKQSRKLRKAAGGTVVSLNGSLPNMKYA